jgi:hypothetical protein
MKGEFERIKKKKILSMTEMLQSKPLLEGRGE